MFTGLSLELTSSRAEVSQHVRRGRLHAELLSVKGGKDELKGCRSLLRTPLLGPLICNLDEAFSTCSIIHLPRFEALW